MDWQKGDEKGFAAWDNRRAKLMIFKETASSSGSLQLEVLKEINSEHAESMKALLREFLNKRPIEECMEKERVEEHFVVDNPLCYLNTCESPRTIYVSCP